MKKVLVLGTGFGQLPLIAACKKLGYYTVGLDVNRESVGADEVDVFYEVDIKDIKSSLAVAVAEQVDAAVTLQSDLPVPTIGFINSALNLTGVKYETALICSHKDQTRIKLSEYGVNQPQFRIVESMSQAHEAAMHIGFPCIIKASDSSGSRGVTKVYEIDDVARAFEAALLVSSNRQILVEEFIDGIELGAQTFSHSGKCLFTLLHNDTLGGVEHLVPTGHSYPFHEVNICEAKVKQQINKALEAVGLEEGPANIDLIVTPKGDVHIIEIGARVGATCLPELTSIYVGFSWEELVVQGALGHAPTRLSVVGQPCAALVLEAPDDGILREVNYNFDMSDYSAYSPSIEVTARLGDRVSKFRKGTDRIGKVVAVAETVQEAERAVAEIKSQIVFTIDYD